MQIQINIGGIDRTSLVETRSFRKEDNMNELVDSLSFTVPKSPDIDFEPTVNSEVVVTDLDTNTVLFGGHISEVERDMSGLLLQYHITCVDYTAELARRLVFERFEDISVQNIIEFIIGVYAPNFTTEHVNAGDFLLEANYLENIQVGDDGLLVKYVTEGPYHYAPVTGGNVPGRWNWSKWGTEGS